MSQICNNDFIVKFLAKRCSIENINNEQTHFVGYKGRNIYKINLN